MEREVLDGANVGGLGARRHVADRHVIDHALPQRRNLFDHRVLLLVGLHERAIVPARALERRALPRCPQGLTSQKGRLCDASGMALLSHIPYHRWSAL
jgi:hypothetical protein